LGLAVYALSGDGLGLADILLLVCFAAILPWTVIGFWNAVIGFCVMRFARDPIAAVVPPAARVHADDAIAASVAITMFVRNEPPARVIRNLEAMLREIDAAGAAKSFHLYVLSDTNRADVAELEEAGFAALAAKWNERIPVTHRRRSENTAFKAGNFWYICER